MREYKAKLNITDKSTLQKLKEASGVYRFIYNLCMNAQIEFLHILSVGYDKKFLTGNELYSIVRRFLKRKRNRFLSFYDSRLIKSAVYAASKTYLKAFKYGFPPYYSRKKTNMKFKTSGDVRIYNGYVTAPKIGKMKLYEKGYLPTDKKLFNVTFSHDGNDWYISFQTADDTRELEQLSESTMCLDFNSNGTLKVLDSLSGLVTEFNDVTLNKSYKKAEARRKKLMRKLVRQTEANTFLSAKGMVRTPVTTRNMLKTKKAIKAVEAKMSNIKTDYFKKVAHMVAKTKPKQLYVPSETLIKQERGGLLTRTMRKYGSSQLLNLVKRKLSLIGTEIKEFNNSRDFLSVSETLGSRAYACGGVLQVPPRCAKVTPVKQELPVGKEQQRTKNSSQETK